MLTCLDINFHYHTANLGIVVYYLKFFIQCTCDNVLGGLLESAGGWSIVQSIGRSVPCRFLVRDITLKLHEISTSNFVGR